MMFVKIIVAMLNIAVVCGGGNGISKVEFTYETPKGLVNAIQYDTKIAGKCGNEVQIMNYTWNEEKGTLTSTSILHSRDF